EHSYRERSFIKLGRSDQMFPQLEDLEIHSIAGKYGRDLSSQTATRNVLFDHGIAQDVAYFFFHAVTIAARPTLQSVFDPVFNIANHKLCHSHSFISCMYHDIELKSRAALIWPPPTPGRPRRRLPRSGSLPSSQTYESRRLCGWRRRRRTRIGHQVGSPLPGERRERQSFGQPSWRADPQLRLCLRSAWQPPASDRLAWERCHSLELAAESRS